jgi:multicomponent Na+:H+ antiporter subunit D
VIVVFPILIPFACALLCLASGRWLKLQRVIALVGATGLLAASLVLLRTVWVDGIRVTQIGSWPAPYGITVVSDLLSAIMVVLAAIVGLTVVIYSLVDIDIERQKYSYFPLVNFLLMGVCGAFLTGDIFNLYVWFEVMLMASFVLLTLGGERAQIEGAVKYVTLNLVSSALFLAGIGILYGNVGTLNMADLALKLSESPQSELVLSSAMMFLVAFGIKAAAFPFFFWLPASYHTPPPAVSALFAGLLTKVGVYALIRTFTLIFVQDAGFIRLVLLIVAGATMISGVLGAYAQNEVRRILSFHIVSQIGYMIMGLALFTPLALAGSVLYIIHHIIVKTNLFFVGGGIEAIMGSGRLPKIGGLYRSRPGMALLFAVPAFSLAGVPPFSGFFAKFALVKAGMAASDYVIATIALAVGLLTLVSMVKIWAEAFWKKDPAAGEIEEPSEAHLPRLSLSYLVPMIALTALTITIGLAAGPFFNLASHAADQLLNPDAYIRAVLGGPLP